MPFQVGKGEFWMEEDGKVVVLLLGTRSLSAKYYWLYSKAQEQGFRFHFISGKKSELLYNVSGSDEKSIRGSMVDKRAAVCAGLG